jgi:hypothetical protein
MNDLLEFLFCPTHGIIGLGVVTLIPVLPVWWARFKGWRPWRRHHDRS